MILDGVTLGAPVSVHMCQEAGVEVAVEAIVTGAGGPHCHNGFRMCMFKP
jgi:hypothetical protein